MRDEALVLPEHTRDGEHHADAEPARVRQETGAPDPMESVRDRCDGERRDETDREQEHGRCERRRHRVRPTVASQRERKHSEQRQQEVEDDLVRQRPCRDDPDSAVVYGHVAGDVVLQEEPVGGELRRVCGEHRLEEERDDQEHDPVRRQDPQSAVGEVLAPRGRRPAADDRRRIGPVEQEAAEDEEERHAVPAFEDAPGRRRA